MGDIFDFEGDIAGQENQIGIINVSKESLSGSIKLPFNVARRIGEVKSILNNHSLLALQAHEQAEPLALTRAKYVARLNPKWTPEAESELYAARSYLKAIEPTKSTAVTLVTPSASMVDALEENRPASYTSSFSPSSFKSPSRLRFRDQ